MSGKEARREVKCDDHGFDVIENERSIARVCWIDVLEVFAYKVDLAMYDEIHLGFRISADGTYWWVSEEFVGYGELLESLKRHFPGIREDWFSAVAFPAFAPNRTTLWGELLPLPSE